MFPVVNAADKLYITVDQKIIPSDLLFYLQNKVHSTAHDDIVKICANFYNDEYVWEEKEKFFLAIGKKPIKRRTSDKKIEDLNDILTEKKRETELMSFSQHALKWN